MSEFMRYIGLLEGSVSEGLSHMQRAALELLAKKSWAPPSELIDSGASSTPSGHESETVAEG